MWNSKEKQESGENSKVGTVLCSHYKFIVLWVGGGTEWVRVGVCVYNICWVMKSPPHFPVATTYCRLAGLAVLKLSLNWHIRIQDSVLVVVACSCYSTMKTERVACEWGRICERHMWTRCCLVWLSFCLSVCLSNGWWFNVEAMNSTWTMIYQEVTGQWNVQYEKGVLQCAVC